MDKTTTFPFALKDKYDLFFLFISLFFVSLAEIISYNRLGVFIAYFQMAIIFAMLCCNKTLMAFLSHAFFLLTSLEWPADLTLMPEIFTYRTVRFLGLSISTIVLLIIFVHSLIFYKSKKNTFKYNYIVIIGIFLFTVATLTGFLKILFGLYDVHFFVKDIKYWLSLAISIYISIIFIRKNKKTVLIFEIMLANILLARSIIMFFGGFMGLQKGNYGGVAIFSYDAIDILLPFLIFYYNKNRSLLFNLFTVIAWFLGMLSMLLWGGSGKGIILYSFVIIYVCAKWLFLKKGSFFRVILLAIFIALILLVPCLLMEKISNNILFSNKFLQAKALISFNWIHDPYTLPPSPRDRVLESLNILNSYIQRPGYFLLGKGFGGYFEDSKYYNITANAMGGYSAAEVLSRKFVSPHESFNVILLKFGFIGLVLWITLLIKIIFAKPDKWHTVFSKYTVVMLLLLVLGFSLKLSFIIGFMLSLFIFKEKRNEENIVYRCSQSGGA